MRTWITLLSISLAGMLAGQNPVRIKLNQWASGITRVTDIAHCGDTRLFVTQQSGIIKIITDSNTVLATPFLNMQSVVNDAQNEQGLLGLVFDPDYATNGFFYTHYTGGSSSGSTVVSRWSVSAGDPNIADAASEQILYTWPQPAWNHNGGDLDFGPDGMLYVSLGDGGGANDTYDNAGDYSDPLAGLIRIDVSDPDTTYTIPPDNPYAGTTSPDTLPEIWAEGLRNPYRIGFDQLTGDLWIGDVGQNAWEEINFWPAGDHSGPSFGWHCREGFFPCSGCSTSGCPGASAFVDPVVVHENMGTGGSWCSSIGGRVYRGTQWPHLYAHYIYTDYCGGEFRSLLPNGSGGWTNAQLATSITGFAVIADNSVGELFAGNNDNGRVYRIVDKCPMDPPTIAYNDTVLTSSPANSYTWHVNGLPIGGSNSIEWTPVQNGDYHVVADFGGGCTLSSDTIAVVLSGIMEHGTYDLNVFPDPASDVIRIQWSGPGDPAAIRLADLEGRTIMVRSVAGTPATTMDVSEVRNGQYLLLLCDRDGVVRAVRQCTVMH